MPLIVFALVLALGVCLSPMEGGSQPAGPSPGPRGIFALSTGTAPLPGWVFGEEALQGVSLRAGWRDIEPREGGFAWPFDSEIERVKRAGKTAMLRITPGHRTPRWVYEAGTQAFGFVNASPHDSAEGQQMEIPVPWDPVFLAKWKRLVEAFGDRYANNDSVVLVHVVGPAGISSEMHLPKTNRDREQWAAIGYSKRKLVDAWKTVIDAYAAAFPRTHLAINVAIPVYVDGVVEEVLAYGHARLGRRFCVQHNALAAKTKASWTQHKWVLSYRDRAIIGFQFLVPAAPQGRFNEEGRRLGGTLADALTIGLDAGASYFEIYPVDLRHEPSARAIRDFAKRNFSPRPPGSGS